MYYGSIEPRPYIVIADTGTGLVEVAPLLPRPNRGHVAPDENALTFSVAGSRARRAHPLRDHGHDPMTLHYEEMTDGAWTARTVNLGEDGVPHYQLAYLMVLDTAYHGVGATVLLHPTIGGQQRLEMLFISGKRP